MQSGPTPLPFDPRSGVPFGFSLLMDVFTCGHELRQYLKTQRSPSLLRLFACRGAEMILEFGKKPEQPLLDAIEIARLYALGQASLENLRAAHERSAVLVQHLIEIAPGDDQWMAEAYSGDESKRDRGLLLVTRRAAEAANACTVGPAPVAAAGALYYGNSGLRDFADMQTRQVIQLLAERYLDGAREWRAGQEEWLLKSLLKSLPGTVRLLVQTATDSALRIFACRCATNALDRTANSDRVIGRAVDVAESYSQGRASEADLESARSAAEVIVNGMLDAELNVPGGEERYTPDGYRRSAKCAAGASAVYCATASAGLAAAGAANEASRALDFFAFGDHEERWIALAKEIFEGKE